MKRVVEYVWHRAFKRPYRLRVTLDQGEGQPVVLLHGIGSFGGIWQNVARYLQAAPYRVLAFDLLGFGESPKPEWAAYSVEDHARAVIFSIRRLRPGQPVILVGHSMGCLVAARVARARPDLVRHVILYEMPLYLGLPELRRYTVRRDMYFKLYKYIITSPHLVPGDRRNLRRSLGRMMGLDISRDTWNPFIKSLENTVMHQTALDDLKYIKVPMDIIYGSLDLLVIKGKPRHVFGTANPNLKTHTIVSAHSISRRASRFLAQRIRAVTANTPLAMQQAAQPQRGKK